jgi:hypothetical protein
VYRLQSDGARVTLWLDGRDASALTTKLLGANPPVEFSWAGQRWTAWMIGVDTSSVPTIICEIQAALVDQPARG